VDDQLYNLPKLSPFDLYLNENGLAYPPIPLIHAIGCLKQQYISFCCRQIHLVSSYFDTQIVVFIVIQ
jgi:hypothetical protein